MSLESGLHGYLAANLSVGARVYPMGVLPQNVTLPAVTYQIVAGPTTHYSHGGPSDYAVSLQFDCWAEDADGAIDLAQEVQDALDGYSGTWDDVTVGSVFLSVVLDDYEPDTRLYRRLRQADIHYSILAGS